MIMPCTTSLACISSSLVLEVDGQSPRDTIKRNKGAWPDISPGPGGSPWRIPTNRMRPTQGETPASSSFFRRCPSRPPRLEVWIGKEFFLTAKNERNGGLSQCPAGRMPESALIHPLRGPKNGACQHQEFLTLRLDSHGTGANSCFASLADRQGCRPLLSVFSSADRFERVSCLYLYKQSQSGFITIFCGGGVQVCLEARGGNDRARASIRRLSRVMARFMRTATLQRETGRRRELCLLESP